MPPLPLPLLSRPRNRFPNRAQGLSLIEILVSIAIVAILIGILVPAIGGMTIRGDSVRCVSNLRVIGSALQLYASEHNGQYPPNRFNKTDPNRPGNANDPNRSGPYWQDVLASYVGVKESVMTLNAREAGVFFCPADEARRSTYPAQSYGNNRQVGLDDIPLHLFLAAANHPGRSLWLVDMARANGSFCTFTAQTWPFTAGSPGGEQRVDFRHGGMANGVFLDGSVDSFNLKDLSGREAYEQYRLR